MELEVSTDGVNWDYIDSYTGISMTWEQSTYSLDDYIDQPEVRIRFSFHSNDYIEDQGMYIDDFELTTSGVGIDDPKKFSENINLEIMPNPSKSSATVSFYLKSDSHVRLFLVDNTGQLVKNIMDSNLSKGDQKMNFDVRDLVAGNYFLILDSGQKRVTRKLVIIH